jgi:hypothetical protein
MSGTADQQLLKAAAGGDLAGVEEALKAGADVEAKGAFNDTALNQASTWGHAEVVKRLLEAGADVENLGGSSMTPIMNAASRGHFDVVRLLLQKGARISDDLLSIIQTKINILTENAEAGMVRWEGVEAWKGHQNFLLTERHRQDVPAMVAALSDPDGRRRAEATRALADASRRGVDVSPATEGLRPQLSSSDGDTREQASEALSRCLAFAGDADGMQRLLEAGDERRQTGAIGGLTYAARDGADVSPLVASIAGLLAHRLPDVRFMAGLALAFGASNKTDISPTLPALTRLLSDSEPKVRRGASTAFALIARSGIDIAQALPALRALLEDPDAGVRTQAAKAVEDASRQPR